MEGKLPDIGRGHPGQQHRDDEQDAERVADPLADPSNNSTASGIATIIVADT